MLMKNENQAKTTITPKESTANPLFREEPPWYCRRAGATTVGAVAASVTLSYSAQRSCQNNHVPFLSANLLS